MKHDAHEAIKALLKNPDSAKFDDALLQVYPSAGLVCGGKVNAKNSFGAYNGYETYYYSRERGAVIGNSSQSLALIEACTRETEAETVRIYKSMGKAPPVHTPDAMELEASAAASSAEAAADAANSAEDAATLAEPSAEGGRRRFPYVAPDGVDIRSAKDEANWKKFGTTQPDGGE